jgi:hypothetical protein
VRVSAIVWLTAWLVCVPWTVFAGELQGGFLPENPESYKTFPLRPTYRNVLPATRDLSNFFPPVGRQGAQSSCVGWALGYAARSYYARRESGSDQVPPEPFSPSFIYNQTKEGSCSSGSSISSGLKLLETVGIVGLSVFPYDPKDCSRQPTPAQLAEAKNHRIKNWARVETAQINALKAEIYQGNPVVIGLWVTSGFYQLKKGTYSDMGESPSGGHALVLVGYDDERQAFKLFNSWGENWGEGGYGWISYAAMMQKIQNAFVMVPDEAQKVTQPAVVMPRIEKTVLPKQGQPVSQDMIDALEKALPCVSIQAKKGAREYKVIVGDVATRQRLSEWLGKALGAESDKIDIEVRPWPQCEAIQTLKPFLADQNGFSILINGQSEISLKEGDSVMLTIQRPEQKKFLSVFYLEADGGVVSLTVPSPSGSEAPQEHIILGHSPRTLTVGKPLGEEMVIAIASDRPLPDGFRSEFRRGDRTFLNRLRNEILADKSFQQSQKPTRAAYAILHTAPFGD